MGDWERGSFFFDRGGAPITPQRWEELTRDLRYRVVRITETDRYRVETTWTGVANPIIPSPSAPAAGPPAIFQTTVLALQPGEGQRPAFPDVVGRQASEEDAAAWHDLAVAWAELAHPKQR